MTYSKEVSPRHDPAPRISQHRRDMWTYSWQCHTPPSSYQRHTQFTATASVVWVWRISLVWFVFGKALLLMPNLPVSLLQLTQFLHQTVPVQGVSCWVHDHSADIFQYRLCVAVAFFAPSKATVTPVEHAALRCFWSVPVFTRDISYHLISPYISPASFRMPTNLKREILIL